MTTFIEKTHVPRWTFVHETPQSGATYASNRWPEENDEIYGAHQRLGIFLLADFSAF